MTTSPNDPDDVNPSPFIPLELYSSAIPLEQEQKQQEQPNPR